MPKPHKPVRDPYANHHPETFCELIKGAIAFAPNAETAAQLQAMLGLVAAKIPETGD